jgi:hypothetical protein
MGCVGQIVTGIDRRASLAVLVSDVPFISFVIISRFSSSSLVPSLSLHRLSFQRDIKLTLMDSTNLGRPVPSVQSLNNGGRGESLSSSHLKYGGTDGKEY